MLKKTKLCEMLGIEHPIIQAPMGPYITTELAIAVTNAGGFGTISHSGIYFKDDRPVPKWAIKIGAFGTNSMVNLREAVQKVNGPLGVNVRVAMEQIDAKDLINAICREYESNELINKRLVAVITSAGNPKIYTKQLKEAGLLVFHVVPSVYHAKKAEDAGVDGVVASGHEAGGHVAHDPVHTSVLTPAVVDAVKVPVMSAGGWSDGRGLVTALVLGADAAYMGTRFIATQESDFAQGYKEAIVKASERDTVITAGSFGPIRALKNKFSRELNELLREHKGNEKALEVVNYKIRPGGWQSSYIDGETDDAPVLTGEVQGRCNDIPTCKDLIDQIISEAEAIIEGMPQKMLA